MQGHSGEQDWIRSRTNHIYDTSGLYQQLPSSSLYYCRRQFTTLRLLVINESRQTPVITLDQPLYMWSQKPFTGTLLRGLMKTTTNTLCPSVLCVRRCWVTGCETVAGLKCLSMPTYHHQDELRHWSRAHTLRGHVMHTKWQLCRFQFLKGCLITIHGCLWEEWDWTPIVQNLVHTAR